MSKKKYGDYTANYANYYFKTYVAPNIKKEDYGNMSRNQKLTMERKRFKDKLTKGKSVAEAKDYIMRYYTKHGKEMGTNDFYISRVKEQDPELYKQVRKYALAKEVVKKFTSKNIEYIDTIDGTIIFRVYNPFAKTFTDDDKFLIIKQSPKDNKGSQMMQIVDREELVSTYGVGI